MKQITPLVACLALAAASPPPPPPPAALAGPGRDGEVRAVSVRPASGKVEVVIDLQGAVEIRDFTLASPARLVIDLLGARLLAPATLYDGQNRGGVRNIRYAQFRPDTVRVGIDLDALKDYQIQRRDGQVRVQIGSERTAFATWTSQPVDPAVGGAGRTAAPAPGPAVPAPAAEVTTPTAGAPLAIHQYLALHRREAAQSPAPRLTGTRGGGRIAEVTARVAARRGRT